MNEILNKSRISLQTRLLDISFEKDDNNKLSICFYGYSSLSSIIFIDQIESFDEGCFASCSNLQSFKIQKSVKNIPKYCFNICSSLSSIIFHDQIYLAMDVLLAVYL
jgi:hypothetical protein